MQNPKNAGCPPSTSLTASTRPFFSPLPPRCLSDVGHHSSRGPPDMQCPHDPRFEVLPSPEMIKTVSSSGSSWGGGGGDSAGTHGNARPHQALPHASRQGLPQGPPSQLDHRCWSAAAQLVPINWQAFDLGHMINHAMFQRNGGQGTCQSRWRCVLRITRC